MIDESIKLTSQQQKLFAVAVNKKTKMIPESGLYLIFCCLMVYLQYRKYWTTKGLTCIGRVSESWFRKFHGHGAQFALSNVLDILSRIKRLPYSMRNRDSSTFHPVYRVNNDDCENESSNRIGTTIGPRINGLSRGKR